MQILKLSSVALATALVLSWSVQADVVKKLDQVAFAESPLSLQYKSLLPKAASLELEHLSLEKIDSAISKEGFGPYVFAVPYEKQDSYTDLGQWSEVGDTAVWRLQVSAKGSKSLNFGFENVFLPQGAKIFVYGENSKNIAVFGEKYNKDHGQIWTPVFEEEIVNIEVITPRLLKEHTQFNLKHINQGFRSIEAAEINKSGSCNIDVVCSQGDAWRDDIRSVARIVIGGSGLCTGTLMNNVTGDGTPYFLSAEHCGITSGTAPSLVVYWNYETSVCDGTPNGSLSQFQSGSQFRALYAASDFALVELDEVPDSSFNAYYAGWDVSSAAPNSAVAIHHPSGDEKRISFDNDPLTITAYGNDSPSSNGTHLRVGAWDEGTTEPGSSGSGIWNSDHRLVGTLSGGAASCSAPNDPDWYGRMSVHWTGGGSNATRLSNWLDPNGSGTTAVDGAQIAACDAPSVSFTINPSSTTVGTEVTFTSTVSGGSGQGYTYAWDFNGDSTTDATTANATYTYNSTYNGSVRLTVTDDASCSRSATQNITVGPAPSSGGGGSMFWILIGLGLVARLRK